MSLESFYAQLQNQLDKQLPCVIYRKVSSNELHLVLQENDTLYELEDYASSGFVFASFDDSKRPVFIPQKHSTYFCVEIADKEHVPEKAPFKGNKHMLENRTAKLKHEHLVSKGIEAITSGAFTKVVLSRKEEISLELVLDSLHIFQKLISCYPKAFVYLWYHPQIGMWLGATPETLLHCKGNEFSTMALAGTQPYQLDNSVSWASKEIEEQELVAKFIIEGLSLVSNNIVPSKTYTHRAGTLLHLRTDIKGNLDPNTSRIEDVIKILHPTPAVCGLPRKETKSFILQHEEYDRKFYTGFLGELNMNRSNNIESNLFVNLRCMELVKNKAVLYVGGGITKDSVPEKEWEETVRKTETMKRVLF